MRIAVAGVVHETNTFAPFPTRLEDFTGFDGTGIARGADVLAKAPPKVSLQGFVAAARGEGHEIVPLLHAHAQPAAHVAKEAFESICAELLQGLRSQSWDAVFLELHGAMVAEHIPDADAEILRRVRDVVGPRVPVVVTLDSHGNVGEDLVALADGAVAYRTYPHIDMRETGERAWDLLQRVIAARGRPLERHWLALPFLMPINLQTTMAEPCAGLYRELASLEQRHGVCLSLMTGFPLADVPQCQPTVFGYGEDARAVKKAVEALHAATCETEAAFATQLPSAGEAVAAALAEPRAGTLLLADVQDNAGGGATSDTPWIIESLLDAGAVDAVVGLVFDPDTAQRAHRAGISAVLHARVGGKLMPGQSARELAWTVEGLHDGDFLLNGPMLGGGRMDLGRMAQLRHGGVRVVVTSRRTWYVERECFRVCGVHPERHRIVVVKSTNHYRADFTGIAAKISEFAAPAAVAMDPSTLPYRHVRAGLRLHGGGPAYAPPPVEDELRAASPTLWLNPARTPGPWHPPFDVRDIAAAADRFSRFAPLLQRVFPELQSSAGRIESPLLEGGALQEALGLPRSAGRLLLKADHQLPVAGSIKARGGVHEVLEFAESVARRHGLLTTDYGDLASDAAREVFSRHLVAVGSTGNLGLSIGVTAAALGFRTAVHMSHEAKAWKKDRLRRLGVTVVEHAGDYQSAVAAGRRQAAEDPLTHFVDDERSASLLLGYAAAIPHLMTQLARAGVTVDGDHPLFVYLPCGVGGAPGGIALGLALQAGPHAHCFFAEPVQSPCFAIGMLHPQQHPTVYDLGLSNATEADGLAVPQASELAMAVVAPFLGGGFTVADDTLFAQVALAHRTLGLQLEPSAVAGFSGPLALLRSQRGREYLARHGSAGKLQQATHLAWTTGGAFVPQENFAGFLARGEALLRQR